MAADRQLTTVKPVFILRKDLPPAGDRPFTTREICGAAEKATGFNAMEGAQQIGGLWRVYPKNTEVRTKLIVAGINLRNMHVAFHDDNPFLVGGANGREIETTKVIISNIPISFSNREIENVLKEKGCKPVSKLIEECDREENGRLTRWKTGRRFIFIERPSEALPREIQMGMFTARVYHREQKTATPFCGNCLTTGHRKGECVAPIVCRICRQAGHKAGDILCGKPGETTLEVTPDASTKSSENEADCSENESDGEGDDEADLSSSGEGDDIKKDKTRKRKQEDARDTPERETDSDNATPDRKSKLQRSKSDSDLEALSAGGS